MTSLVSLELCYLSVFESIFFHRGGGGGGVILFMDTICFMTLMKMKSTSSGSIKT